MNKLAILTLFLTFTFINVKAQDSVPDSTLSHVIYKDVKAVLSDLGSDLKVGSEHVYTVLVRQQIVNSAIYLSIFVSALLALCITYNQFKRIKTDYVGDIIEGTTTNLVFGLIAGIPGLIMLLIALVNIGTIVTGIINPEYGAIEKILSLLKQ